MGLAIRVNSARIRHIENVTRQHLHVPILFRIFLIAAVGR